MSHYLRAPAFSWNALLNMTKVELEASCFFKRYSKAINKYLTPYDPKQESKHNKIKKLMLSNYQLNIVDFYNIPIGIVKKSVLNFFFFKKRTLLKVKIEAKKIHHVVELNQSQWLIHISNLANKKE